MPFTLGQMAKLFTGAEMVVAPARAAGLEKAARLVEEESKRVIGTYEYGWPQLAFSTQEQRERAGYNPNEPLLRTGELRDSIEHFVDVPRGEAFVGSNNPIAKWQELGTSRIPPRSFLMGAAMAKEKEIIALIGGEVVSKVFTQPR